MVVRATAGLCAELGLWAAACGVETEEQHEALRALPAVQHGQGLLYGPPVPADEVPALLDRLGVHRGAPGWPAAARTGA